jgi:mRNA-degrading endonuclease RelE of RelBE toxin-antitoxin system
MTYTVQLSPLVLDRLARLSDPMQDFLLQVLSRLAETPRPPDAICLDATHQVYRRRLAEASSMVYRLYESNRLIYVTRLSWRPP